MSRDRKVPALDRFDAYVSANAERFITELKDLCRLPSISAQGKGMSETAAAVAARMQSAGLATRLDSSGGGFPVVYGRTGAGQRGLLVYDHYDVQPPEPLEEWSSDPFSPEVRNGHIYARGVADNKGPLMARIQAVEAWHQSIGELPLRAAFVVEGEEEIGSPHLAAFIENHRDELQTDIALWEGGGRDHSGAPMATLGFKGLASFNLHVRTARQDQHSMWGGLVPNAVWRLVWALGTLKNSEDEITIDGLKQHVRLPTRAEIVLLDQISLHEAQVREQFGIRDFVRGLSGSAALAKHLFEPACTINGFWGGYTGQGGKTVLPAEAFAKIDIRLVPELTPDLMAELLRSHLDRRGFSDVEIEPLARLAPFRSPLDHPMVVLALRAGEDAYGAPVAASPTSPGSGPMYQVCGPLGIPGISIGGMNHAAVNIHGPNENIDIRDYLLGISFTGRLFAALGAA